MRGRVGLVVSLLIGSLFANAAPAQATDDLCWPNGDCFIHWDSLTVNYQLLTSLPSDWKTAIRNASSEWAVDTNITSYSSSGELIEPQWVNENTHIIWRGQIPPEWQANCPPSNTLACTGTNYFRPGTPTDNHIFDADMVFNSSQSMGTSNFNCQFLGALTVDVETLALHELGHFIGLAHSSETSSVMATPYDVCDRDLAAHDWNSANTLYAPHGHA
jgi:hypothetical protein